MKKLIVIALIAVSTITCIGCDLFLQNEHEHTFGEWSVTTPATCTTEGVKTRICTSCDETETQPVSKLDHSYNAVVTNPTCTAAGFTAYTCDCGDSYVADEIEATDHQYGDWNSDSTYHWKSCDCGDIIDKAEHFGGAATESEQATCEDCGVKYGEPTSHVHNHSASVTLPTCTEAGFTTYACSCGDTYIADEVNPLGHDMQTKYDAENHWKECANGCGEKTEKESHNGGTATETERAKCDVCGQEHGELKTSEKTEVTVFGKIVDDTYVSSDSKTSNNSEKEDLNIRTKATSSGTSTNYWRSYFKFNFSDVLAAEGFEAGKDNAKLTFTFAVTSGTIADDTTFTFYAFNVDEATDGVAFSNINWSSVASGAQYEQLGFNNGYTVSLVGKKTMSEADNIAYADGIITITVNYSDIEACMDANGNCIFGLTTGSSDLKVGSMENEGNIPTVFVTYTK